MIDARGSASAPVSGSISEVVAELVGEFGHRLRPALIMVTVSKCHRELGGAPRAHPGQLERIARQRLRALDAHLPAGSHLRSGS